MVCPGRTPAGHELGFRAHTHARARDGQKDPLSGAEVACGSDGLGGAVGLGRVRGLGRGGGLPGSFGFLLRFLVTEGGAAGVLGVNAREGVREGGKEVPGLGDLGRVGALGAAGDEAAEARDHLHPVEWRALADADMALTPGAGVGNIGIEGIAGVERLLPSIEPGDREIDGGDKGVPVGGAEGAEGLAAEGVLFARGQALRFVGESDDAMRR